MRRSTASVCLLLAALLLLLGFPRVVASALKAPAFTILLAVERGDTQADASLEKAAGYLDTAARWEDSGHLRTDLGFLQLLRAAGAPDDERRRGELAGRAAEALRGGLRQAPVQPHAWVRLAYARTLERGPSAEIAALLAQSFEAGPFVGEITLARLELLLANWNELDFEARVRTGRQIRYAWPHRKSALVDIARRSGGGPVIRLALRSLPGAAARFDAELARAAD